MTDRKPDGYWNEENILIELTEIIKKINHFPSLRELQSLKRYDLQNAISRNGGLNYFREKFGFQPLIKPNNYWTEEKIIEELKKFIAEIGHFPTQDELLEMKRSDLQNAIRRSYGINKFRKKLGVDLLKKNNGYWTEETIIDNLRNVVFEIKHFPSQKELVELKRQDLLGAIQNNGGIKKFIKLMGYKLTREKIKFWTDEKIIIELKEICKKTNSFPSQIELNKLNRGDLIYAIIENGGTNKFRKILGFETVKINRTKKSWTIEKIKEELDKITNDLNHFPSTRELSSLNKQDLLGAIYKRGGLNYFRLDMGHELLKRHCFWNDENIIKELKNVIHQTGFFPSEHDLKNMNRIDLDSQISINGGYPKFRELLGYSVSLQEKYKSELSSYIIKRGKNSEKIVIEILKDYCKLNNYPEPILNSKLCAGNIIEIVCNVGKRIGIDVTNVKANRHSIYHKWSRKDYYKHLDELWVIVLSNRFTEIDYLKWNNDSPPNVKVMSIDTFLKELDYSVDEHTKQKIEKYKQCTFHTKEEFIKNKEEVVNNLLDYLA